MHTFTRKLSPPEQERFLAHLRSAPYDLREVDHAIAAAKKPGLNLVLYRSGKLVAQGKGVGEWIEFVLEPEILREAGAATPEATAAPDADLSPHIGIDESGKGDFFGPLVVAAFLVTPEREPLLRTLGVRDSKRIKSDSKIASAAEGIEKAAPRHCEVMVLAPETYNSLVKRFGSVNRLLAWAHATVLENLLDRFPDVTRAVADQFGPEHQITSALKQKGKGIDLVQRHRAESDPAVAAASILARHRFVKEMEALGGIAGRPLPRGATHVRGVAEELVRAQGPDILSKTAKTHFRTTRQVLEACGLDPALLGTPEPKKFVYRKK